MSNVTTPLSVCVMPQNVGVLFIYTQAFPLFIAAAFTGVTALTGWVFFAFLGIYMLVAQYFLWPFQAAFNRGRNPLLCPIGQSQYAFPSVEMFYAASLLTLILFYVIGYRGRPGVLSWLSLCVLLLAAPFVLLFFEFNEWWEVLFSALMGIIFTTIFMVHMWLFWGPAIPYLETIPPFSTFSYNDDFGWALGGKRQKEIYTNYDTERRELHRVARVSEYHWKMDPEMLTV